MKKITNKALIIAATVVFVSVIVAVLLLFHTVNKEYTTHTVYKQGNDSVCIEKTEVVFIIKKRRNIQLVKRIRSK